MNHRLFKALVTRWQIIALFTLSHPVSISAPHVSPPRHTCRIYQFRLLADQTMTSPFDIWLILFWKSIFFCPAGDAGFDLSR